MVNWPAGHLWEDTQLELLGADRKSLGILENASKLRYKIQLFGQGEFSFSLHEQDAFAESLKTAMGAPDPVRRYIRVLRDGVQRFCGRIEHMERRYTADGHRTEYINVAGRALAWMLHDRYGLPIAPAEELTTEQKLDDAFNWTVNRTHGSLAPLSVNGRTRVVTGFSAAADVAAYPDDVALNSTKQNIFDLFQRRGAALNVDFDVTFVASGDAYDTLFTPYYPRRGEDRTESNTDDNDPIVINDAGDNVTEADINIDLLDTQTSRIDIRNKSEVTDTTAETNLGRIEGVSSHAGPDFITDELHERRPMISYVQNFKETEWLQFFTHFNVGDKITYENQYFQYAAVDTDIAEATVYFDDSKVEHIELVFGDPVPKFTDKLKGGRVHDDLPSGKDFIKALRDEDNVLADFHSDNTGTLVGDGTYVETEATTQTIATVEYEVIKIKAIGTLINHDVLSATHSDTVVASPVRGDIIIGNATPKWERLPIGTANKYVKSDGTDISWDTIAAGDVTGLAHNVLSATHSDSVAGPAVRGSIIVGNATPAWAAHAIGDAGKFLKSDGTDVSWEAITTGDFTGYWTREDNDPTEAEDWYLRPTTYLDDVRLKSASDEDRIWMQGDTGKANFGDDVYIGSAETAGDGKLHVTDVLRGWGGMIAEAAAGVHAEFAIIDSGIAVINNQSSGSISFQVDDVESLHLHGDLEWASFRNGVSVLGSPEADGSPAVWTLSSDTGSLYLDPAATTTLGNYVITWPLADADTGDILTAGAVSGSAITLAWVAPGLTSIGNGTAEHQVLKTGSTPFAPVWHTTTVTSAADSVVRTDASGYIRATRLEFGGTTNYAEATGGNQVALYGSSYVSLRVGSAVIVVDGTRLYDYAAVSGLGTSAKRWTSIYGIAGNYTGDITIGTGKGLVFTDNSNTKVLGGDGTRYSPRSLTMTGHVGYFTPAGNTPVRDASGNALYWVAATGLVNNTGAGVLMQVNTGTHTHNALTGIGGGAAGNLGITIS